MKHSVKAPSVGESITEVSLLKWAKQNGQWVQTGDLLLEIESDKATVEIVAECSGQLSILKQEGERVAVGEPIATIDDSITQATTLSAVSTPTSTSHSASSQSLHSQTSAENPLLKMGPAARKLAQEMHQDLSQIQGTGKEDRITKGDLLKVVPAPTTPATPPIETSSTPLHSGHRRVPMSSLRARIAERLVQAQHTAAILTTFNEVDMSPIMALRQQHKDAFKAQHGVALSFMSFFTQASILALRAIPEVNASIDGRDILYHESCDIGIAVGTEKGLVVPIIKRADQMSFVELEKSIAHLALKAREGKLSISDMSGGTFTISNGGVYGSLMSTPILTPPQSGILGMHKIQERPIAVQGQVVIRPMMYLALSYDHRLIDGKGAVTFLIKIKESLENPQQLGLDFL